MSGTTTENYSVTFIFDVRKEIVTANHLDNMKQAVRDFAAEVEEKGCNVTIRLISQDGNDFFNTSYKVYDRIRTSDELDNALNNIKISKKDFPLGNNCSITDALNYVINAEGIYSNNYVFDMYSQTNTVYNNSYVKRLYSDAQKKKINISIISDSQDVYSGYQGALARSTGGLILNDYKIIDGSLIFNHIFGAKFSAILLTGYEPVQLNAQLNSRNSMDSDYVNCAEDDDLHTNDHLTDWEEVGIDHWVTSLYANADKTFTAQWNAGFIEQTDENIATYEMSKMVCRGFVIIGAVYKMVFF